MKTLIVTVNKSLPMNRIGDLLCTMYESSPSIAQWAECIDFILPTASVTYRWEYPMTDGALLFKDIEANNGEIYTLDLGAVQRGLQVMAHDYPRHWADFLNENEDSITADVFLQCALFGSVIYG